MQHYVLTTLKLSRTLLHNMTARAESQLEKMLTALLDSPCRKVPSTSTASNQCMNIRTAMLVIWTLSGVLALFTKDRWTSPGTGHAVTHLIMDSQGYMSIQLQIGDTQSVYPQMPVRLHARKCTYRGMHAHTLTYRGKQDAYWDARWYVHTSVQQDAHWDAPSDAYVLGKVVSNLWIRT